VLIPSCFASSSIAHSRAKVPIPQVARENLVHEHVGRLDAYSDHPDQQGDHRIYSVSGCFAQPLSLRDSAHA
jgi:hypothetical protein